MSRTALLLGASGLVGSECLKILLKEDSYGSVQALVRRPLAVNHPKLIQHQVSFDALDARSAYWSSDAVFCCLGTTIKKAGSQEAFRRVDYGYPLASAQCAVQGGAVSFFLISSVGADARSPIFYNRIKGETEDALHRAGLPSLVILRPSLILGERAESRPGERIASALMKPLGRIMVGPLRRYRPIQAHTIARAMVRMSISAPSGTPVLESEQIQELGKE